MRVINIVKDLQPIRMGVWLAASNTALMLRQKFNVDSEIWFPGDSYNYSFEAVTKVPLKNKSIQHLKELIQERNLSKENDIIVTHSAWDYQSAWGNYLASQGFKWIFMPHGNLEPWALSQKWLKKKIYIELVEKPRLSKADAIRAISIPEQNNLQQLLPHKNIVLIHNGFDPSENTIAINKPADKKIFLFMARLHHKKGVLPLVQAWLASPLKDNPAYELIIAGPDEDELEKIKPLLAQTSNAKYIGAIYNKDKEEWLNKTSFYILPSKAEGFPMSILEAACKGAIPVISDGCNFPEIFAEGLAIKTGTEVTEIKNSLIACSNMSNEQIATMSIGVKNFIENNFSTFNIAQQLYNLYSRLLEH